MNINTHLLDITGASLSFLSTFFSLRVNILTWPFSIAAVLIGITLYSYKGLYGDAALHLVYLVLSIYGWYQWKFGGKKYTKLPITSLSPKMILSLSYIAIAGIAVVAAILYFGTNSKVPLWDASVTVISLIAEWMTCKKIIQNWIVWFFVDILFTGIYFYKDIPAHGILHAGYLIMAIVGYFSWRQLMSKQRLTEEQLPAFDKI